MLRLPDLLSMPLHHAITSLFGLALARCAIAVMEVGFFAALLAGALGAGHCLTMCGAIAVGPRRAVRSPCTGCHRWTQTLWPRLVYNSGRITSYVVAGCAAGAVGAALGASADRLGQLVATGLPAGLAVRAVSALLLMLVGMRLLWRWPWLHWPERAALRVLQRIAPKLLERLHGHETSDARRQLALGLLWGWLPCGQSYSMLLLATATGEASSAALLMLGFGLGTLPAMLGVSIASDLGTTLRRASPLSAITGLLMIFLGSAVLATTSTPLLALATPATEASSGSLRLTTTPSTTLCHPPEPGGEATHAP